MKTESAAAEVAVDDQEGEDRNQQHPQQRELIRRGERGHWRADHLLEPIDRGDGFRARHRPRRLEDVLGPGREHARRHGERRGRIGGVRGRKVGEHRLLVHPGGRWRGAASGRNRQRAADHPGQIAALHDVARLERVIRIDLHQPGARHRENPALRPVLAHVGNQPR